MGNPCKQYHSIYWQLIKNKDNINKNKDKNMTTKAITPKTINGHVYTGSYIPATEACFLGVKLLMLFTRVNDNSNIDATAIIEGKDSNLMLSILSHTLRGDMAINNATFDTIYTGNLKELMEALQFAVEVNFSDFLQASGIGSLSAKTSKVTEAITGS